ncbi:MAG: discoidin domain-containing protein [Actinomycetota bacterium]|nr:discoidin domain-containing protein [Actinomycetota bacterium]
MRAIRTAVAHGPVLCDLGCACCLALGAGPAGATTHQPATAKAGAWVLTATSPGGSYAPTFTGNGLLGVRVPPSGQGYAAGSVPAESELAGFYAQPSGAVQQRANIPSWSTLTFSDAGAPFSLGTGTTSDWRQSIDFRTGTITTSARWSAPDGHVTDIRYQVLTDRADPYLGLVSLSLIPHWSGAASVTDAIDGTPATLSSEVSKGWSPAARSDWVTVQAQGTNIDVALASQLALSSNVAPTVTPVDQTTRQSVGQELSFPVSSGHTYTIDKFVGVESSQQATNPTSAARAQAASAAAAGYRAAIAANDAAWKKVWQGRIELRGNPVLATMVNASEFYLWSSIRPGVDWSISPAGLSSNGYNGHIFWDAETWMYPSLLAMHPDLAAGINAYRFARLAAAEQHAAATGYKGARFPWESALDGTEQIPPPVSTNSEGLYEQHITADIALAQWQYYLATGDRQWLAQRGWPVISQAAAFWASRVSLAADGTYHIYGVTGPDEEDPNVNDEVYTAVAAKTTLIDAVKAAGLLGISAPSSWSEIPSKLVVLFDPRLRIHPEFAGYRGQLVKQADVTMIQYPWAYPMPARVAQRDINYYVPRTDPQGPSMSDAVNSIDTSALGTPGCASYVFTERSFQPFIRDVFDQFSETKTGGAFTFMTGIGGFLQEFIYGYSGLRFTPTGVQLSPSLTAQLPGVVLHGLVWHGRRFTVAIGLHDTTVTLQSGGPLPVLSASGQSTVTVGHPARILTRRPDLLRTADAVRCAGTTASSFQPGASPLAAVDGSPATDWQPATLPARLTVALPAGLRTLRHAMVRWGQQWPPAPGPNIPPPPGPVITLRASSYMLLVSTDGLTWRRVATVSGRGSGTVDTLRFKPVRARFVRVDITAATGSSPPMLQELNVTG